MIGDGNHGYNSNAIQRMHREERRRQELMTAVIQKHGYILGIDNRSADELKAILEEPSMKDATNG